MKATPQKRDFLIYARKNKGFTQFEIAKEVSIDAASYCNIETGKRNPSVKLAKQLGKILDVDWTLFFGEATAESANGINLFKLRKARKMTLENVARAIGVSTACYAGVESGRARPSVKLAKRVANYFDFDWTELFNLD